MAVIDYYTKVSISDIRKAPESTSVVTNRK